jgi:hypothetical protein
VGNKSELIENVVALERMFQLQGRNEMRRWIDHLRDTRKYNWTIEWENKEQSYVCKM